MGRSQFVTCFIYKTLSLSARQLQAPEAGCVWGSGWAAGPCCKVSHTGPSERLDGADIIGASVRTLLHYWTRYGQLWRVSQDPVELSCIAPSPPASQSLSETESHSSRSRNWVKSAHCEHRVSVNTSFAVFHECSCSVSVMCALVMNECWLGESPDRGELSELLGVSAACCKWHCGPRLDLTTPGLGSEASTYAGHHAADTPIKSQVTRSEANMIKRIKVETSLSVNLLSV